MAKTLVVQESWENGMKQDIPRHALPKGTAWKMVDCDPTAGAVAEERGGFTTVYSALGSTAVNNEVRALGWCRFSNGTAVLTAVNGEGKVYRNGVEAATGMSKPTSPPVFFDDKLIFPAGGAVPAWYDDGSAITTLATAPLGQSACIYKSRLVLAGDPTNNYISFSGVMAPGDWTEPLAYIEPSFPTQSVAALRNCILVFSGEHVEIVKGSIPPPNGDMSIEVFAEIGGGGPTTIAFWRDNIVWANQDGIWMTDGASTPVDITAAAGISKLFRSTATATGWAAAAVYGDLYILSLTSGLSTIDGVFVVDLRRRTAWLWSQPAAYMFAAGSSSATYEREIYFSRRFTRDIASLSSAFTTRSGNDYGDAGLPVKALIETPFYGRGGPKRIRDLFATYDLRDAGATATVTAAFVTDPKATAYTNLSPVLGETTSSKRVPRHVRRAVQGIAFKFTRAAQAAAFRLYELELDVHGQEPSRHD